MRQGDVSTICYFRGRTSSLVVAIRGARSRAGYGRCGAVGLTRSTSGVPENMSLTDPNIIERLRPYKTLLVYGGLGLLLIGLALFFYSCGSDYFFKRDIEKKKDEIANTAKEIANISNQIANLEVQK